MPYITNLWPNMAACQGSKAYKASRHYGARHLTLGPGYQNHLRVQGLIRAPLLFIEQVIFYLNSRDVQICLGHFRI